MWKKNVFLCHTQRFITSNYNKWKEITILVSKKTFYSWQWYTIFRELELSFMVSSFSVSAIWKISEQIPEKCRGRRRTMGKISLRRHNSDWCQNAVHQRLTVNRYLYENILPPSTPRPIDLNLYFWIHLIYRAVRPWNISPQYRHVFWNF